MIAETRPYLDAVLDEFTHWHSFYLRSPKAPRMAPEAILWRAMEQALRPAQLEAISERIGRPPMRSEAMCIADIFHDIEPEAFDLWLYDALSFPSMNRASRRIVAAARNSQKRLGWR